MSTSKEISYFEFSYIICKAQSLEMSLSKPIYKIAKDLNIDTNKILLACNTLGIHAKAASKKLNTEELEKIINYFNSGKNVSSETIEVGEKASEEPNKKLSVKRKGQYFENTLFPNRLIG